MAAGLPRAHYIGMKDTHIIDRLSHDQLWEQVLRREPGDFLYAVSTVGVFCRPGCPSPRPLRKNVCFFRTCSVEVARSVLNIGPGLAQFVLPLRWA